MSCVIFVVAPIWLKLFLEKASRNSKSVKYLERKVPSLDATQMCVSYAEAKFGRLCLKPITVPLRVWLSWKGTKMLKRMKLNTTCVIGSDSSENATTGFIQSSAILMKRRDMKQLDSTVIRRQNNSIFHRECTDFPGIRHKSYESNWDENEWRMYYGWMHRQELS